MMNRILGIILILLITSFCNAQTIVANNQATTSTQGSEMTFYNLQYGTKTTVLNNDWHLAVSVRPTVFPFSTLQGTSLRINEAFGTNVYEVPGFTQDSFTTLIDTTNFHTWTKLHDSDTLLDLGALNSGVNISNFFYGWGAYTGAPKHNVAGTKVYLFEFADGTVKKLLVDALVRDTAWDFIFADIDNANTQLTHISKANYAGKNFVYLNLQTNTVLDKEPLSANWDLLFTKYNATDVLIGKNTQIGVLSNKGRTVAQSNNTDVFSNDYSALTFSGQMNTMGWDWKYNNDYQTLLTGKDIIVAFPSVYTMVDSLSYFVTDANAAMYKIVFTGFKSNTGLISFYKEDFNTVSILETGSTFITSVYPNPATDLLNIKTNVDGVSLIQVTDLNGRLLTEFTTNTELTQLNTANYTNGIYVLSITNNSKRVVGKFVISK